MTEHFAGQKTAKHERGGEKKTTPRLCPYREYSVGTGKNTSATKNTYTFTTLSQHESHNSQHERGVGGGGYPMSGSKTAWSGTQPIRRNPQARLPDPGYKRRRRGMWVVGR